VIVQGRLTMVDMQRLEHACSGALTSPEPKLDIDLGRVTYIDRTAMAILERFQARGIRITWIPPPESTRRQPS
jgi:hypothetical protein